MIDRRIVVDQVYKRAQQIRIGSKRAGPILKLVRCRLRALSGGEPLGVAALRGGVPIENEWAHRPDQPWVMVSTVDQFGSRLLFRGYGVTPGMRPIHAGLAGNDCLVILDEVHLSVPFAETLAQVAALECVRLPRRFGVVEMSATPNDKEAERFVLDPGADLEECEELSRRVTAAKEAELITVRNHDAIPAAVLKIVKSIAKQNPDKNVRSIGVVVNRVRTARDTHRALEEADYTTCLITGRMRPLDRVDVMDGIAPAVDPTASGTLTNSPSWSRRRPLKSAPTSTSTRSSPNAPRLTVSGNASVASTVAVRTSTEPAEPPKLGLSVRNRSWTPRSLTRSTGDSAKVTWEELARRRKSGPIHVGPRSLMDFPDGATAPKAYAPLLLRTHMDAWTQTSPEPIVQPSVEWFLHGIEQDRTDKSGCFDSVALGQNSRGVAAGSSPAASFCRFPSTLPNRGCPAAEKWTSAMSHRREPLGGDSTSRTTMPVPTGFAGKGSTRLPSVSVSTKSALAMSSS